MASAIVAESEEQLITDPNRITSAFSALIKYRGFSARISSAIAAYTLSGPTPATPSLEVAVFLSVIRYAFTLRGKPKEGEIIDPVTTIQAVRKAIFGLRKYAPVITTGVYPSISIMVEKRNLIGVLEESDKLEDGSRSIKAEWTAHNDLFSNIPSSAVLLYFHGGAYIMGAPSSHRGLVIGISKALNCRILSVDYRLSPEVQFPAALHDAVSSLYYLLDTGLDSRNIFVAGDSAGGNLAASLLIYARDAGIKLGGGILFSPWSELTFSTQSTETNLASDYLPAADPLNTTLNPAYLFLGVEKFDKFVIHPLVSPALADLESLPPLLVQAGGGEVLLDSVTLFSQRASAAGVDIQYEIYDSQFHIFQPFLKTEVSKTAIRSIVTWMSQQPTPSPHDFSFIDTLLKNEMKERNNPPTAKSAIHLPAFIYKAIIQEAPIVRALPDAHPVVKEIIEKNLLVEHKPFTIFYKAEKTDNTTFTRLRGMVGF